jgi:phosphatidate cytidylyltransferase
MLRTRVLTALVLAALLLGSFWLSRAWFVAFTAVLAGAAAFEWLRLAGSRQRLAQVGGVVFTVFCLVVYFAGLRPTGSMVVAIAVLACILWTGLGSLVFTAAQGSGKLSDGLSAVLGVVLLAAAWFAALELLERSAVLLLSASAIVWVADIAAYFVGRAFGRRKLAPLISPGKTWAGVWGAFGVVILLALGVHMVWPANNVFTNRLIDAAPLPVAFVVLALLVVLSIVGDLFESLLKRQAGVKDSSGLLPGHGGVLDRVDALLPVLPAAVVVTTWMQ